MRGQVAQSVSQGRGHATAARGVALAPLPTSRSLYRLQCSEKRGSGVTMQSWRNFGPSVSYSDGDAEFFRTTDRLAQQYPGFAPTPDAPVQQQQQEVVSEPEEQAGPGPSSSSQLLAPGRVARRSEFGLSPKQIQALGLAGPRVNTPDSSTLSSRNYLRGDKFEPAAFGMATAGLGATDLRMAGRAPYQGARAAYGDYQSYPEGRPIFLPEAERFGNPPDLPSLLLQQRIIYISMPFVPSVTELVVAQCYYLDFDDKNRSKPIYVYLNSTGCINEQGKAISADNEFYAIWAALGFTRAPLYTGVTWKAQNQAAVLLSAGTKGHRYSFPHAKISTAPPILNRVFGQTVDAQLQSNELEYATKYYAAILARATGKPLEQCQKEYLSRKRYFSVSKAYEEGLIDKLVPGYSLNRFRKLKKDLYGEQQAAADSSKPRFRFRREGNSPA